MMQAIQRCLAQAGSHSELKTAVMGHACLELRIANANVITEE